MSSSRRKFILDCDPGTDDAQALMMALSQPDIELIAITTVFGNANIERTSKNCLRILKFKNRLDIPVYRGSEKGLLGQNPEFTGYHGNDGLGDIHIEDVDPVDLNLLQKEHSALALNRLVNEHPGQITLVATGPLTNVALALHLDPDFGRKLNNIHIMGGNSEGRGNVTRCAEFNFYADPEAAYFVLSKIGRIINLYSLEVCEKHGFSWEWYERFTTGKTKASRLIGEFEQSMVAKQKERSNATGYVMVWDQVAMASAINKALPIKWREVHATIELHGSVTRGQLVIDWQNKLKQSPNVRLVLELNHALFDDLMQTTVRD